MPTLNERDPRRRLCRSQAWDPAWCESAPGGIRTPNLLIRSQMLYPLSHGRSVPRQPGGRTKRAYRHTPDPRNRS